MGGSLSQSKVVRGMVFGREPEGVIKKAKAAKVGVYTCGMDITQTENQGNCSSQERGRTLQLISRGEEQQLEKYFKEIADSVSRLSSLNRKLANWHSITSTDSAFWSSIFSPSSS